MYYNDRQFLLYICMRNSIYLGTIGESFISYVNFYVYLSSYFIIENISSCDILYFSPSPPGKRRNKFISFFIIY